MLYDSEAMRRFAGNKLGDGRIPEEIMILNFRHLLEKRQLTEQLFAEINHYLDDQGITLRSGTPVNATTIDAPSSTKNKTRAQDPEMSSTKKGNAWYFGMKAHVGVYADSGTVHSLEATTAKIHENRIWDELLHGDKTSVWADKRYVSAKRKAEFTEEEDKVWGVMRNAPKGDKLDELEDGINRSTAMVRTKVENPFRVLKRKFRHIKMRYRGLAKNQAQLFTLFALSNLSLVRRRLMALRRFCLQSARSAGTAANKGQNRPSPTRGAGLGAIERPPRRSRTHRTDVSYQKAIVYAEAIASPAAAHIIPP